MITWTYTNSAIAQYHVTTLFNFNPTTQAPTDGLTIDSRGNLYGVDFSGPVANAGYVFELSPSFLSQGHTFQTVATFNLPQNGFPEGNVIIDSGGNLFGTTSQGGPDDNGTAFSIAAGSHTITTIATFPGTNFGPTGILPSSGLTVDANGNMYGVTKSGGTGGFGAIYEIAGGTHDLTFLANLGDVNSRFPATELTFDGSGNLYGTTQQGGAGNHGTVFKYSTSTHIITQVAAFDGSNEANFESRLTLGNDGQLYGTSHLGGANNLGYIFKVDTATSTIVKLVDFDGANGALGGSPMIIDAAGNLYGETASGGTGGDGTIFKFDPTTDNLTTLYSFSGIDGKNPFGLVVDASGNFYGLTSGGGSDDVRTIFELSVPEPTTLTLAMICGPVVFRRRRRI